MQVDLNDIELAIEFVSSAYSFDNAAYLNSETGVIYYSGDAVDEELPDDIDKVSKYISIPSKRDLELGKPLVLSFVSKEMPDEIDNVYSMFRSHGAYSKFKSLLQSLEYVEKWYSYENAAVKNAITEWCKENSIECRTDI
ncbi:conserved hypothetical protein [Psychromonas ingrahamii 37]|uniref:Uncharacterized protein n=1 Tax=Psychromonas ingrahamii (strain DSM 17664 / CCUG 51855 / 37) TaxID=357804 RepID=A1SV52_PSYIN|nr:UPF0158 family protein [Psychromonas ingrahamii]ABM03367.1 conserved hypothetical protein [Psychromonas ingrahamii 37]